MGVTIHSSFAAQERSLPFASRTGVAWEEWERDLLVVTDYSVDGCELLAKQLERSFFAVVNQMQDLKGGTPRGADEPGPSEPRRLPLCTRCFTELPAAGGDCGWCG